MTISTIELEAKLRKHLGDLSTQELPTADAILLLNQSYWEILDKFPFREKEETATISTVIGQRTYPVPNPFEALQMLSVIDPNNGSSSVLIRAGNYEYESIRETDSGSNGMPTKYYREESKIRLWPIPDNVYTMTIKYWTTLDDLVSGNSPLIPQSWHEIILYGACWRGFLELRDFDAYKEYKQLQVGLITSSVPTEAKEERDSHESGLEVLGREY